MCKCLFNFVYGQEDLGVRVQHLQSDVFETESELVRDAEAGATSLYQRRLADWYIQKKEIRVSYESIKKAVLEEDEK